MSWGRRKGGREGAEAAAGSTGRWRGGACTHHPAAHTRCTAGQRLHGRSFPYDVTYVRVTNRGKDL